MGIASNDANGNNMVRLRSSDGQIIEAEEAVISISGLIKEMIKCLGTNAIIPLPNVSSKILKIVMEYCTFHAFHDPQYRPQISREEEQKSWAPVSGWGDEEQKRMATVSGWDDEEQNRMAAASGRGASGWGDEEDVEYARRIRERRAVEQKRRDDVWEWDDEFVKKMDTGTLCEVTEACDYLNILKLRDLVAQCCGKKLNEKMMELFHSKRRRKLTFPIKMGKTKNSWD